jgi:carbonic anhydrase
MSKVSEALGDLIGGYRTFLSRHYAAEAERYRTLAEFGQTPRTLVIACSDSRVDPSRIFNARPGELFIVRNVANLVPPCEEHGDYHGTSAAIEFAVRMLNVERILVLGHARCGGVRGFLEGRENNVRPSTFLEKWINLLEPAHRKLAASGMPADREAREQLMELKGIEHSLGNLMTFPFVSEAVASGSLDLHGGIFDIATGKLRLRDPETGVFEHIGADTSGK